MNDYSNHKLKVDDYKKEENISFTRILLFQQEVLLEEDQHECISNLTSEFVKQLEGITNYVLDETQQSIVNVSFIDTLYKHINHEEFESDPIFLIDKIGKWGYMIFISFTKTKLKCSIIVELGFSEEVLKKNVYETNNRKILKFYKTKAISLIIKCKESKENGEFKSDIDYHNFKLLITAAINNLTKKIEQFS